MLQMARHAKKILHDLLLGFSSVFGHFGTLRTKGLMSLMYYFQKHALVETFAGLRCRVVKFQQVADTYL